MKVIWTPRAQRTFRKIMDWLSENWTKKEIDTFMNQTEETIQQIKNNPYIYQQASSQKQKNVRRGLVNRIVSLYYRIKPQKGEVDLLEFWDNRQNPNKNNYG